MKSRERFGTERRNTVQNNVLIETVMERLEWIKDITRFQARCRGYLIRTDLKAVQAEYEAIVRDLEGSVDHLSWKGHLIPQPHFTHPIQHMPFMTGNTCSSSFYKEDDAFMKYHRAKIQTEDCPVGPDELKEQSESSPHYTEDLLPERDEERNQGTEGGCSESRAPEDGDTEPEGLHKEGAMNVNTGNVSLLHRGVQMGSALTDVPHTPEALLQHRNTLAMELLWIQQAIASRKKYLSLKQKLEAA